MPVEVLQMSPQGQARRAGTVSPARKRKMLSSNSATMRIRVSIVELPWFGCRNTLGQGEVARVDRGLAVEYVQSGHHHAPAA